MESFTINSPWTNKNLTEEIANVLFNEKILDTINKYNSQYIQNSNMDAAESRRNKHPLGVRRWRVATDVFSKHDLQSSNINATDSRRKDTLWVRRNKNLWGCSRAVGQSFAQEILF